LLLPLVLVKLSTIEIAIYYLFATIIGLVNIADFGFNSTFSRCIALAIGGVDRIQIMKRPDAHLRKPNYSLLSKIVGTMSKLYFWIGLAVFLLMTIFGTISLVRLIAKQDNGLYSWFAWAVIVISTTFVIWGFKYSAYLQGVNEIAIFRRWEAIVKLVATISGIMILEMGGGILALIVSNQLFLIFNVLINMLFSRNVCNGLYLKKERKIDFQTLKDIWPPAWKTGIGYLMSLGLIQMSGIIYAQFAPVAQLATLLIGLKIIDMVSQFSQAPFYSKLPLMARLFAQGDFVTTTKIALVGMRRSYISFLVAWIGLGFTGSYFLNLIQSNVDFPEPKFWALLGFGYLIMRFGGMHINLYNLTNDIKNHIANGITGILYLVFLLVFFPLINIYALPLAICLSGVGFYAWYAAVHSYRIIPISFFKFEKMSFLPNLIIALIYLLYTYF